MDKAFGKIYIFFIVLNCLASFVLFGMPKFYTNEHHFTDLAIRPHLKRFYTPVSDITLKGEDGSQVTFHPGDRLAVSEIDEINKEIEEAMKSDTDKQKESKKDDENVILKLYVVDETGYKTGQVAFEQTKKELMDTGRFKNITEMVRNEYAKADAEQRIKGAQEYREYMMNQKIWFLLPHKYLGHFIVGLIAAAFVFFIYRLLSKQHPALTVILCLAFTLLKCIGIIYWHLHPMVCR